jgi:hypothetical protein
MRRRSESRRATPSWPFAQPCSTSAGFGSAVRSGSDTAPSALAVGVTVPVIAVRETPAGSVRDTSRIARAQLKRLRAMDVTVSTRLARRSVKRWKTASRSADACTRAASACVSASWARLSLTLRPATAHEDARTMRTTSAPSRAYAPPPLRPATLVLRRSSTGMRLTAFMRSTPPAPARRRW